MSVIIKGMKMPKNCAECFVAWERCHRTIEWYKNNPQYYDIRHEDCPLVEVPAPHGRLIDADELRHTMYHQAFELDSADQRWDSGCWIRYRLFDKNIEAAPTIIEAEEE